jgi:hypothetical protein
VAKGKVPPQFLKNKGKVGAKPVVKPGAKPAPGALKKTTGPVSNKPPSPTKAGSPPSTKMRSPTKSPAAAGGGINASGGTRLPMSKRPGRAAATGITGDKSYAMGVPTDHVPAHTFASSTMPRATPRKMATTLPVHKGDTEDDAPGPAPAKKAKSGTSSTSSAGYPTPVTTASEPSTPRQRQTGASAYMTPDDYKKSPSGTPTLSAAPPTKTNELAAPTGQKPFPKGGPIKPANKGDFTAKAKAAGMSVQAYASSVLANKSAHPPALVQQANFARNFGGAAKKGGSS